MKKILISSLVLGAVFGAVKFYGRRRRKKEKLTIVSRRHEEVFVGSRRQPEMHEAVA